MFFFVFLPSEMVSVYPDGGQIVSVLKPQLSSGFGKFSHFLAAERNNHEKLLLFRHTLGSLLSNSFVERFAAQYV